jgi:cytochrome c oxidase cbb3-type subunit IV
MLKFIKHNMETIVDIEIYPIISLLIFFTIFVSYAIYAFTRSKDEIDRMSVMPLEDNVSEMETKNVNPIK